MKTRKTCNSNYRKKHIPRFRGYLCAMLIAVNTRFLLKDQMEGYGYFIYESFSRICSQHPEHQFIFIFDRKPDPDFLFPSNVKTVIAGPPARHPLLWKFWYDFKIPVILKKYHADIFISPDGFCSLATKIPQCMVLHDLAFVHYPSASKRSHQVYYRRYIPKFLQKANRVVTVSQFTKNDILENYPATGSDKLDVVYSAAKKIFQPATEEKKEGVKKKYTGGAEFFIYAGAIHPRKNLINLLKAFSVFKKRLQSNMKLVLAGRLAWKYTAFIKSLSTYKYRDDVIMTGYLEQQELAELMASAYTLVYPSLHEGFGVPVLEAMQCHVPVITSSGSSMQEIAGDAAVYANASDHTEIAEMMMRLYKDEDLRMRLIEKGKQKVLEYSWDRTANLLWESICKAAG